LKEEFPNIQLQIFGDGPFRNKIDTLISDLNLADNIEVRNFIPRAELWKRIDKAMIVALPSLHEAQSVSMLEAMAFKKPLVVFDYPFSREIITDMVNGVLAKQVDVKDLTDKIRILIENENLRIMLGENANKYVRRRHNWNTLVDEYIRLYKDATEISNH